MKQTKQSINGIPWKFRGGYWIRFILTFLLALGLVISFSFLVAQGDPYAQRIVFGIIAPLYLTLTLAGAFGGILYSILTDGSLELPTWGDGGNSFKVGSIGEVFVGIAGAFIAYVVLPQELKPENGGADNFDNVFVFVTGLVGGYGGKAVMDAALSKIIGQVKTVNPVEEKSKQLAQQVAQLNEEQSLIKLVNQQINDGLPPSEVYLLSEKIKNASEEIKQEVFRMAKEIRRLSWRTKAFKSKIPRTIPIFQALVDSDPQNDQYHAQLAYAYKDSEPSRLDDSISHLNQAIQLRGNQIVGSTWKYELNRALARIIQEEQQTAQNSTASSAKEEILTDLLSVDRNYGLAKVLIESEDEVVDIPLKDWLGNNQDWIKQRSGGARLLEQAFKVSQIQAPQSSKIIETGTSTSGTTGSRRSIAELKASTSVSLGTLSLRNRKPWSSRLKTVIPSDDLEIAPPNSIIKAIHETYLKKQPIDSSELLDDQKVKVPMGKEYKVLKHSKITVNKKNKVPKYLVETDGYCQVELDYGQGIWYIWSDHWHLPWEEHKDDTELFWNLKLGNDLASRIIKYMKTKGYKVFTNPKEYNIVYIEGMNPDGTLNDDRPNYFNDLRMVIEFTNGQPKIVNNWIATTEPGSKATLHGLAKGAARIKFGQYQAWIVAWHPMPKSTRSHEALYQQKPITVHRDFNKDYKRTGDKLETGCFGINQHWGYDQVINNIYNTSAGCLVGRTKQGHREFMAIIKQDKRYISNKNYVFYTTIIPGDDLNKQFPPN